MNIYTVKWGDKYNHQHVNNIYQSCLQFLTCDFDFYCLTENPKDLHPDIKPLTTERQQTRKVVEQDVFV